MRRSHFRRAIAAFTTVALLLPLFALTVHAAVETVSGTMVFKEDEVALSPDAVAVITLVDRSKDGSGTIIGEQRIDGAVGTTDFSVPYESDQVNNTHAYAVVASLIDGDTEWQSQAPVPTITLGPTEGLVVEVSAPQYTDPTEVTGTIALPDTVNATALTPEAVAYAILVNGATGRVVGRQVNPAPTGSSIPFTVTYDADLVAPDDPLLAVAALADGGTLLKTESPAPVTPGTPLDLPVAESGSLPVPGTPAPSGSPTASGSAEPTVLPSGNPTATPNETPTEAPTATATEAPSATPTEAPSATPTASPSTVPSETPTASPSPTPSPGAVIVSGTLTYREPHRLDLTSVARVVVAQLQGDTATVVGEQNIVNPGAVPIAFSVVLNSSYDPAIEARLWAVIRDGDDVWTTAGAGLAVAGPSGPTENVLVGMFYRPDLIEADVTGTIIGTPADLSASAWSITWLVDTTNDKIAGADSSLVNGVTPIPFLVGFAVADVSTDVEYVVQAAVFDGEREFRNPEGAGVPVITGGNPFKDVEVTVAQVSPSASPTPATTATAGASSSASPTAAASSTPAPTASGGTGTGSSGGIDPVVLGVLALVVIGGAVVIYLVRR